MTTSGGGPRVLACCGGMIVVGGLERMILQALATVRERGGAVHCIVNGWERDRIVAAVEGIGATWSTGSYRGRFTRDLRHPAAQARLATDVLRTSAGMLRDAVRFKPTQILVPEFGSVIRNWPALAVERLAGVPVTLALQNAPAPSRFYRRLWRRVIDPVVTRYVCCSEAARQQLIAHGIEPGKARVVRNTAPRRAEPPGGAPKDRHRVLFVGQLIPEKGLDLLLDAVGQLAARGRAVSLDIVGRLDGWVAPGYEGYRERLLARGEAPDLAGRVRFLGWRDDVPALMRAAGVHCSPSRPEMFEGLPLVVLEAKQAGVPSVAFNHGPFPELIEHGRTGWLCPEMTAGALAEGLDFFLGDARRQDEAARLIQASAARYSHETFADGWWNALAGSAPARTSRPLDRVFEP
jgi:glycosyltransferase involved in cell wall biosynthesis